MCLYMCIFDSCVSHMCMPCEMFVLCGKKLCMSINWIIFHEFEPNTFVALNWSIFHELLSLWIIAAAKWINCECETIYFYLQKKEQNHFYQSKSMNRTALEMERFSLCAKSIWSKEIQFSTWLCQCEWNHYTFNSIVI